MKNQYKNVELIPVTNTHYRLYISQYKNFKKVDVVYNTPTPKKADTMGKLLESTIAEWVKGSRISIDEKIIRYEYGFGNNHKIMFKEVDYVLKQGRDYTIGEVKVSSTEKGNVTKACQQLSFSKEILTQLSKSVTMQIIRIDLNFKNTTEPLDEFNSDFLKSNWRTYEWEGHKFQLLHLSAQDVFNYGVSNKIIKSPEIFEPVIRETELIHQRRQAKEQLKEKKKAVLDISNVDELEIIQAEISIFERAIFLYDIKISLSHQGWSHIPNQKREDYQLIIDSLGKAIDSNCQPEEYCERTNGFRTDDVKAKYTSFYNASDEEIEVDFLDAERVYLRLSDEEQAELQNIKFISKGASQLEDASYPLLRKSPYRMFFYSNTLLIEEDSNNKSVQEFEHVICQSEPTKIALKAGDILIIDNHRMLYRIDEIQSERVTKMMVIE